MLQVVIILNQKPFPVLVLRECDNMPTLPHYERLIIVSETFRPELPWMKSYFPRRLVFIWLMEAERRCKRLSKLKEGIRYFL